MTKEINAIRASTKINIPVVLTRDDVRHIVDVMEGAPQLIVKLLYGCGLRAMEAVRLRSHDIGYQVLQISVRSGKGAKDRFSTFASSIIPLLNKHLSKMKIFHDHDLREGYGRVYLLYALSRKYPNVEKQFNWQYVFPLRNLSTDTRSGKIHGRLNLCFL